MANTQEQKKNNMKFPNLIGNSHDLRITADRDIKKGELVAILTFERRVSGWSKETKKCDSSFVLLAVAKAVGEGMKKVKQYVLGCNDESKVIWLGDAEMKEQQAQSDTV